MLLSGQQLVGLPTPRTGKVREVYDLGTELLIVATDRISAFDVVMGSGIPDKGRILNQMSLFWFDFLRDECPNHVIAADDEAIETLAGRDNLPLLSGRTTIAKKAAPLPIECVARSYITGSLLKEYRAEGGHVHGLDLPDGLVNGSKLPEPIFTPATKADSGHDLNISWDQAVDLVGIGVAETVRDWTLALFRKAQAHAATCGLILADTKFEFGLTPAGVIWIDEALTPDSSRYWEMSSYAPGQSQPSLDKQYVRDYLESIAWNKLPPGPELPADVIEKTREKYLTAFHRLTGREHLD